MDFPGGAHAGRTEPGELDALLARGGGDQLDPRLLLVEAGDRVVGAQAHDDVGATWHIPDLFKDFRSVDRDVKAICGRRDARSEVQSLADAVADDANLLGPRRRRDPNQQKQKSSAAQAHRVTKQKRVATTKSRYG
jgi:hypothetical protein